MNKSPKNRASIKPNYSIFNLYSVLIKSETDKKENDRSEREARKKMCFLNE